VPEATGSGPVRPSERVLAPDLARGLALLGIALANCVVYVYGRETGPLLRPVDGSTADRVVDGVVGLFVDNRAFPMFTMLFAYGYVMILRRQAAAGVPWPQAQQVLLRRSAWLAVFGAAHMLLLFFGDILLTYGLLGLALAFAVRWSERVLRLVGWSTLVVLLGLSGIDGLSGVSGGGLGELVDPGTFLGAALIRAATLVSTVLGAPLYVGAFAPAAVIGILLARRRVLEEPAAHLALLRRLALGGLAVSVLGAVPLVLMSTQLVDLGAVAAVLAAVVHGGTGLAGAVGFIGLVGWFVAVRGQARTGIVGAVSAVGARSLTCYLLQSVLFVPLLSPWALGLGDGAGTAFVSAVALGVYLTTVAVAVLLERAGRPGPAEQLLRHLTYRGARPAAVTTA
jgi:uncharacterized protein